MYAGIADGARGNNLRPSEMNISQLLMESNMRLRKLTENLCCAAPLFNIVVPFQVTNCAGDPIGSPVNVVPVINLGNTQASICNYVQLAEAIATAIEGGVVVFYNEPIWELATDGWNLSDNNDIAKVHSISISVTGTPGDTADLTINGGTAVTMPVGFSYNQTFSSTVNKEYTIDNFTGSPVVLVSGSKSL